MSKAVLISIRPEWCRKIIRGEKTMEVRRGRPKVEFPFKVYIYCTLSGMREFFRNHLEGDAEKWNSERWGERKGMVVGEFVCDRIDKVSIPHPVMKQELDPKYLEASCLKYSSLRSYERNGFLYFWNISDLKVYDNPKSVTEFGLKKPPQSWGYVEELK